MNDTVPLWTPSPEFIAKSPMYAFMQRCNEAFGLSLQDYAGLHAWSIAEREQFWCTLWDFCDVRGERGGRALADGDFMLKARFFPDARLNFAENLLRNTGEGDALILPDI